MYEIGDQQVRGSVVLPHGLGGKDRVVLVFAEGDAAAAAKAAGADHVGGEDLAPHPSAVFGVLRDALAIGLKGNSSK